MEKQIAQSLLPHSTQQPLVSSLTAAMFTVHIFSSSVYSIVAPFMPLELAKKQINEAYSGYIFGAFSLAFIFGSPCMSSLIQAWGRKFTLIGSCFLMGMSVAAFASINCLKSNSWFIVLSLVSRGVQGIATVGIQVTNYSIAATFYS